MADDIDDASIAQSHAPSGAGTGAANTSTSRPNAASSASTARTNVNPDRTSAPNANTTRTGVVQPKPQALPKRSGPASIIVSPRQKGNPVLNHVKGVPWEYGDIPADYVLGLTTCALFLSLKYHKLHPEYIYNRIKALQGKYNLRVVLVMVDVQNHEDSLKELSKTSLINNVTLVLCWSAAEGGRYLELFKTYEHAAPTSIKQHQSTAYADRMVDFITGPRSINKTDAVSMVSQFGTVRTAVNARHEDVAGIAGWGEKKVKQWCGAMREPFRIQRTARRGLTTEHSIESRAISRPPTVSREASRAEGGSPSRSLPPMPQSDADRRLPSRLAEEVDLEQHAFVDDEEAMADALISEPVPPKRSVEDKLEPAKKRKPEEDPLSEGVMAALSKLRKGGG